MATQGFGKPKYGGGGNFTKSIRLKEGTPAVVRILPPMKSLAESGEWAVYFGTHFGYKGVNPKDRSKPQFRTFKCIEQTDYKTKMVLQDCPECDLIRQRQEEKKEVEAQAKKEGHNSEEIKEIAKPLADWLSDHNCDRKWHMNVMLPDGSNAVLQISHRTKKLLEAEIARVLTEDGIEALELDQGVWFKFTRAGKGIDTQDSVSVEYESVKDAASSGRVIRIVKLAPLTEAQQEKALKDCQDLSKSVREISYEQIKLLSQCSGDDEDVDAIFALGEKKKEASPTGAARPLPAPTAPAVKAEAAIPVPKPVPAVEDDEETAALLALEAIKAKKAQRAAAALVAAAQETAPVAVTEASAAPMQTSVASTAAMTPAAGLPVDRAAFMARFRGSKQ